MRMEHGSRVWISICVCLFGLACERGQGTTPNGQSSASAPAAQSGSAGMTVGAAGREVAGADATRARETHRAAGSDGLAAGSGSTAPPSRLVAAAGGGAAAAGKGPSAAGSSAAGGQGVGAVAGAASPAAVGCELSRTYTRATRTTLELTWPDTVGLMGGRGTVVAWGKAKYSTQPDGTTRIESRPCGTLTPTVMTTALVGSLRSAVQIPLSAFDSPNMPTFVGVLTRTGSMVTIDPGPSVLGTTLSNPTGAWPQAANLMPTDQDGDGSPGLTALPVEGDGYFTPPSSASQTEFLDRVYIASRVQIRVSLTDTDCSARRAGHLESIGFDNTVVGCHVRGRDDCTATETRFIANQSPKFMVGQSGTFSEVEIPADASCADVRAALPMP